ncbi:MAG: hypothetical protein AAF206_18960, partial [Bacteroidota bacterium]
MKSNSRSRNLILTLSTLAVALLASLAYFYLHIGEKEDYLHDRHFRVLQQIGQNIQSVNSTYVENARNYATEDINKLKDRVREFVNDDIRKVNREWQRDFDTRQQEINVRQQKLDMISRKRIPEARLADQIRQLDEEIGIEKEEKPKKRPL